MTETLTERLDDAVEGLDGLTDWKLDADEGAVRFRARTRPTEPNDGRTWSLLVDLTEPRTAG